MQQDISEQPTAPIPFSPSTDFHSYLVQHRLTWVQVARAAGVPVLVVWSIDHGLLVESVQAACVRRGLARLTGEVFSGCIATISSEGRKHYE
jgi:N-glycosylase/DNA lyase